MAPWFDPAALTNVELGLPVLVVAVLGISIAVGLFIWVRSQDRGTEQMKELSDAIQRGARTFLYYEYRALAVAVAILFVLFTVAISWQTGICYLCGAVSSAATGYAGMMTTTMANSRTTKAAEFGLNKALRVPSTLALLWAYWSCPSEWEFWRFCSWRSGTRLCTGRRRR